MKNTTLVMIFVTTIFTAKAQNAESISLGKKVTIHSNALKEDRRVWIYDPALTSMGPVVNKQYPVVYVLDGEAHFLSTVGIIQQLSQANGNSILPEMMVVGIENTDRSRDLVPSPANSADEGKVNPFVNFLKEELMPFVTKNYHTAPYNILVGHSLGGLTAIDILANSPELFNAYIAIDPSMSYDDGKYLNRSISRIRGKGLQGRRLFIGAANTMPKGMTLAGLGMDGSAETVHLRSIFKLNDFLKGNSGTELKYMLKYYEHESHVSVPLMSEYDGLRFIFDYYRMDITERDLLDSTPDIAVKYRRHFDMISNEMGYMNAAPEAFIKYLGFEALARKQFDRAEALLRLNVENYPGSGSVYESYADFWMAKHDSVNAVVYYKKALAIGNDAAVQHKLEAIVDPGKITLSSVDLRKYTGVYVLEKFNVEVELGVRGNGLWAVVKGQADDELEPLSQDVFSVRNKQGYTVTFKMAGNRAVAFTSIQPNGTFIALLKK
jgi:predicted alpha/beta superfamily hydrolase